MAGTHHTRKTRRLSVALVSAATATATALTVGVEPPPAPAKRLAAESVDLAAAVQLLPDSGQYPNPKNYPDLTGGLGSAVYNASQTILDQLARAIVNGVSLTAFAQAAGVDPQSLVNTLLADIPANLLPSIITAVGTTIDLPILSNLLGPLNATQKALLTNVLDLLGVDEITDGTLTGLLGILGLNLADPLNLSNLTDKLGVNIITAGPTFTALKLLGLDLGWVPGLPNSVANEINGTPYLKIGLSGVLGTVIGTLQAAVDGGTLDLLNLDALNNILGSIGLPIQLPTADLTPVVKSLITSLGTILNTVAAGVPDVLHTRVTPTIGIGLGAFAAAMAYQQVVNDLANQPGGLSYTDTPGNVNPILGSLTILPMVLINNPARPDGGLAARFGPLAALLGIDTVNPHTQLTGNGGAALGTTGLHLGGANVLPILIDATYEYQPLSDFASWPNAVTVLNNLAAGLSPTYLLRGLDLSGLGGQLTPQLTSALTDLANGKPLALNLYLTLHSATLPLLEPLYLASDFLNIVGLSPLAQVPMRLANALAPALRILTDVGYANVVRNPDGTYTRDFSAAGQEVPFLSFPKIDPGLVFSDTIKALFSGIQKELGPNPTAGTPNVLKTLLDALTGGGLGGILPGTTTPGAGTGTGGNAANPLAGLGNLLNGLLGGLLGGLTPKTTATPLTALSTTSATSVPLANAQLLSLSSKEEAKGTVDDVTSGASKSAETGASQETGKTPESTVPERATESTAPGKTTSGETAAATDEGGDETPAAETANTTPKHAKPDDASAPTAAATSKPPKHAKPDANDGADADTTPAADTQKAPKHAKPTTGKVRDTAHDFSPEADRADKADKVQSAKKDGKSAGAEAKSASDGAGSTSDKAA